jgi:ribosome maturation protein SDO1
VRLNTKEISSDPNIFKVLNSIYVMTNTTARIKRGGKHFEILVDLDEALLVARGKGEVGSATIGDVVFYNLKSGERSSEDDLETHFGTSDFNIVAKKIMKSGEIVRTTESISKGRDEKLKRVVDFLVRNAVSPEGRPYTPDRITRALKDARVVIKNKSIESQVSEILNGLRKVLPIKIERKKVKLVIPAMHSGRAYGIVKEFIVHEVWKNNGDLEVEVEVPSGMIMDFYDRVNSATQGSVISEELR